MIPGKHNQPDAEDYMPDGFWVDCWSCGGEGFHESCFEDCCVCVDPPCHTTTCDVCEGAGGWYSSEEG